MASFVQGSAFDATTFECSAWFVTVRRKIIAQVFHSQVEAELEPNGEAVRGFVVPTEGPPEDVWELMEGKT